MTLRRSLAWMGFAQGGSFFLQFIASVVLARLLTPHELGIYAIAAATVGALSLVQAFGLQTLIVREEQLTPEIVTTAFTINLCISLGLAAMIVVISAMGGAFLGDPGVGRVLMALAVIPLLGTMSFLPSAQIERSGQFKIMSLVTTASVMAGTAVTVTAAFSGATYMSMAYGAWTTAVMSMVSFCIVGRRYVSFRLGVHQWRRVTSFGLQMLAVGGISGILVRVSEVMLGKILGLSALALYNRANGLNGLIWNNLNLVAGRVILVDFAEMNRQGVSLRERYMRTLEVVTGLFWPAFAGMALLSGPFILVVYGERWLGAAPVLSLLCISSMILISITMTWEVFAATGKIKAQTRIEFIRAIIALLMFVAGCTIGLVFAAAARVADSVLAVFFYRPHLDRMTQATLVDLLPIYARGAVLTGLAIAPTALLMAVFRLSVHTPLVAIIATIFAGVGLWAAGLFWLKHPLRDEMIHLWSMIAKRLGPRSRPSAG